ncbi:hypothetical protein Tco_0698918 [Tanacetum coccineum]
MGSKERKIDRLLKKDKQQMKLSIKNFEDKQAQEFYRRQNILEEKLQSARKRAVHIEKKAAKFLHDTIAAQRKILGYNKDQEP